MSKIKFIIDWRSADKFMISRHLINHGLDVETLPMPNLSSKDYRKHRYPILLYKYLLISYEALSKSRKEDIIVSWNFTIGFCCCLIRYFSFVKPKVVCLNIIAHESKGVVGLLRKKLFSFFLNKEGIHVTANSESLFKQYNNEFKIKLDKMYVLEDPILSVYENREFIEDNSYIFCGGVAKRDWETLFKACNLLPDYKFVCVASRNGFPNNLTIPNNATMHFDVSLKEFNDFLKGARIQVLPLASNRPAGLIGLITGAMLSIPIITSRTPSMENYISDGENGMLIELGDYKALSNAIELLYNDPQLCFNQVSKLRETLTNNYSEEAYSKKLLKILKTIDNKHVAKEVTRATSTAVLY